MSVVPLAGVSGLVAYALTSALGELVSQAASFLAFAAAFVGSELLIQEVLVPRLLAGDGSGEGDDTGR